MTDPRAAAQALASAARDRGEPLGWFERGIRRLGRQPGPGAVLARGRHETDDEGPMPSPLTHAELAEMPLASQSFEDFLGPTEHPPVRRFRAVWTADPAAATRDRAHSKGTPR